MMCHIGNLNEEEMARFNEMDIAHRRQLGEYLERGDVSSTRRDVVPAFERFYSKWQEINRIVAAARKPEPVARRRTTSQRVAERLESAAR
jgi:hypothetical protein